MSKIQWTDETWNPTVGCSRVSPGCEHCYAEGVAHRGMQEAHRGLTVVGKHGPRWNGVVRLLPERLATPLRWRKPRRVFVDSMSDLFNEAIPFEYVAAVFGVMAACPQHTFQVLTKRPEVAQEFFARLNAGRYLETINQAVREYVPGYEEVAVLPTQRHGLVTDRPWPLPNVWLGTSVEDQQRADERIPELLKCPAAVRFLSCEPLLEEVNLEAALSVYDANGEPSGPRCDPDGTNAIKWVILGGESGRRARPCALEWIGNIVDQCTEAGVACFVKQLGSVVVSTWRAADTLEEARELTGDPDWPHRWLWRAGLKDSKGGDIEEFPDTLKVRQFPGDDLTPPPVEPARWVGLAGGAA